MKPAQPDITIPRVSFLLYSSFLALAAVSIFLAFVEADTAYTGYIWKYSTHYIYQASVYAATLLIAAVFITQSSLSLIKQRPYATIPGLFGCLILVAFPAYLLIIDPEHAIPTAVLIVPALLLILVCILLFRKKRRSQPAPKPHHTKEHKPGER